MDAFGYKIEDGKTIFAWVLENTEGQILWLSGELGVVQNQFIRLGDASTMNFDTKAIPMLKNLDYIFDFNDKCQELSIRFPLSIISNVYNFRFERLEPLINSGLQRSGNGFCDQGYCDETHLNLTPCVYSPTEALKFFSNYLPKVLSTDELVYTVWQSENGVLQQQIWSSEAPLP